MQLPSGTAIPGALTQFMTIATAALPSGSTIWFGEELPTYTAPVTLQITEITGDQKPAEMGTQYRREETFGLVCSIVCYQGGEPDFPTILGNVTTNFVLVSQAVANNPTLNSAVRFAQVGNFHIVPVTDANGMSAISLDFVIRCEQRVTSLN